MMHLTPIKKQYMRFEAYVFAFFDRVHINIEKSFMPPVLTDDISADQLKNSLHKRFENA